MNLPNYFLADLPAEAALSPTLIREACLSLKRNRELYLARRSTGDLVNSLCAVAKEWLHPDYPLRRMALEHGSRMTGFARGTIATGLDSFFRVFTPDDFEALLEQDLGHTRRLDAVTSHPAERQTGRAAIAVSPALLVHVTAGNLPNPAWMSMVLGVLARSAQFVKCASGMSIFTRLFAHSLHEADPKLGACLEVAEWPGGTTALEKVLFDEADCVTATGSDETLENIRQRLPSRVRFVSHGHRLSFGYVSGEFLVGSNKRKVIARVAADVAAWNQLGCLSPHVIYVQHDGGCSAEAFAELLANELEAIEAVQPRGGLPISEAAAIASRRSVYEIRAANSTETRLWCSQNSSAWTVVYEEDPRFQISCLNRFVYVKPVRDVAGMLAAADSIRERVSTIGLAVAESRFQELAGILGRWGATRICPVGRMQQPPLTWRHDGRGPLAELVTWTDCELP